MESSRITRLSSPGASAGIGVDRCGVCSPFWQFLRKLAPTVVPASATDVVVSEDPGILQRARKVFKQRLGEIVVVSLFVAAISLIASVENEDYVVGEDVGRNIGNRAGAGVSRGCVDRVRVLI